MQEQKYEITENQLLFILDKVEDCYKDEVREIVEKILKAERNQKKQVQAD